VPLEGSGLSCIAYVYRQMRGNESENDLGDVMMGLALLSPQIG